MRTWRDAFVRYAPGPAVVAARRTLGAIRGVSTARRDRARWSAIERTAPAAKESPRVSYGHAHVPALEESSHGGMVKFQYLQRAYPNAPLDFNLIYMGSSSPPRDLRKLIELARRRGAPLVWNQNGVGYPGWAGADWRRVNEPMQAALGAAAHVFYQSEFCKLSADRFAREPVGTWEVLHNPVDTTRFVPRPRPEGAPFTLLLGGNQYQRYRYETALRTVAALAARGTDVRLRVTGTLSWRPDWNRAHAEGAELAEELGVTDRVELVGPYTQQDAPAVLADADILLHTKYNDPCPGLVLEAMACGVPVVYSDSGGTPELVGDDAGIGVPAPLDFEHDHPPDPDQLADAVLAVASDRERYASEARRRAVELFDLERWIERHRAVFAELLGG